MVGTSTGTRSAYETRGRAGLPDASALFTDVHILEGRVARLERYVEEQREQAIAAMRARTERLMRWTAIGTIMFAIVAWGVFVVAVTAR